MSQLFSPFKLRGIHFRNRIFVSPMCQYSSDDGMPNDWHLVHLGSRAVGGAACVIVEATGVSREGRISPADSGIWSDAHATAFRRITAFMKQHGTVPGVQLAHAGRKASTDKPWLGGKPVPPSAGGWQPIAPSPIPFNDGYPTPREMTRADIHTITEQFVAATKRSVDAGFELVEIHMAHGYLLHSFLSPLSNHRTDDFGGSLANRMRFPLQITRAMRDAWPAHLPLLVRISATDWVDGGWDLPQSIAFARELKKLNVDLIDCSSGGSVPTAKIALGPGYQVPFARAIREDAGIPSGAVGMITDAEQAESIIANGEADIVLLARAMLRDPYWPIHAADQQRVNVDYWPKQYGRAR
jgi:2,4-dienoyl-CoA reductase-like NADH-dependent reductase (Old Yellow Enzyme family)